MAQDDPARSGPPGQSFNAFLSSACSAAVGAALALFFLPTNGRDMRSYVQQRGRQLAGDVADRGREMWNQQRVNLTRAIERAGEKASGLGDQISEAIEQGRAGFREAKQRRAGTDVS